MTQEDKELLLKDLCARQMHNVKCRVKYSFNNETTNGRDVWTEDDDTIKMVNPEYEEVFISYISEWVDIENVKQYLRSLSSMTKDEEKELGNYLSTEVFLSIDGLHSVLRAQRHTSNFLYSKHFDILGLIEKGLAFEAPEDMYKN